MAFVLVDKKGNGDPDRISYGKKAGKGFQYVLKHGLGPMTLPKDVGVIRSVLLSNALTVVYLDRVLEAKELEEYDIPNEWENKGYLEGIKIPS